MTTNIKITKGKYKNRTGRVVGVYTDGRFDVKIGRVYAVIRSGEFYYID